MTRRLVYLALAASFAVAIASLGHAQDAPTPRMPDGHPDLSGVWGGGGGGGGGARQAEDDGSGNLSEVFPSRRCAPNQVKCSEYTNQSEDGEFTARNNPNRPVYKPEFWDKVQELDMWTNKYDPIFQCQPLGVPRVGPPARILQTGNDVVFLYAGGGASTQPAEYRVIPTDGRPFDPVKSLDVYFYGLSVGHWEGDTLVIESIAFNDLTWLDKGGYFHSDKLHVVEKLTRQGNTLRYEVTAEDPEVLAQPWVLTPRTLRLNPNKNAGLLPEGTPCKDYDHDNMVTQIRH
ncbi:MAG: hypothetical protein DMF88_26115 [Acidobacteria bacterium]|nr:MAG: hypothetical protein DMF88_26115 [Acidobacteriota bacterium]